MHIHSLADRPHLVRDVGVACFDAWPEIAAKDFGLNSADEFVADLEREMREGTIIVLVAHTDNDELVENAERAGRQQGGLVGTVSLRYSSDMPNHLPDLAPWMACLFVSEGRRNQGVGSRLVRCVCDIAFGLGIPTVYLWTEDSHVVFYKRRGWTEKERIDYFGTAVTVMQLDVMRHRNIS